MNEQRTTSNKQRETKTLKRIFSRLHKFTRVEHTIFSLPLLFAGAWLGTDGSFPSWQVLFLIIVAGTGARTFGMAMNRILDRDLDARNPRTSDRELPSGKLSLSQGYAVAGAGIVIYLLACAGLGRLCLLLSPVPLIPLTAYSLLKRVTIFCHFGIGVCLSLAPLGAFVAVADRLPLQTEVLLLAGVTLCWIAGFDIIYGLQDIESDREVGVKSIPAALGSKGGKMVAAVSHFAAMILLVTLWLRTGPNAASTAALIIAAGAFAAAYVPLVPLPKRFFPLSAIAGVAAACVVLLSPSL